MTGEEVLLGEGKRKMGARGTGTGGKKGGRAERKIRKKRNEVV